MLKLKSALISVFNKDGLEPIAKKLDKLGVKIYSTGGTELFLKKIGIPVIKVEDVTGYPSILGGRVKTLHPKIFGGILNRNDNNNDVTDLKNYEIPNIDLVIVDLYPFEETVKSNQSEENIIEKIDIGGISLIRAAAKNFKDVMCVSSKDDYSDFLNILNNDKGEINLKYRKNFAFRAFNVSSHYDTAIFNYFKEDNESLKASYKNGKELRYGENPHQKGMFYGDFNSMFEQLHGKELSYNNLLDVDAAVNLILEFYNDMPTFAILKHNNACGLASRNSLLSAYKDALAGDPVSAFGGVLISNKIIDVETAEEINKLFCEVVIAPGFEESAIKLLKSKKNRILLVLKNTDLKLISFLRFSTSRDESLSLISISEFIKLKILLLDAIDLSKSSTSIERLVNGHKKRCVKKTSTLYAPTAKVPLSAIELPISIVPKNPARTPILITGLNALLIDIAFMFSF